MADKELRINLTGDSKDLERALSSAQQKLVAFSGKMKDIGKTLSYSLTAPMAVAGTAAIKMASDFNESLNKVDVAFKESSAEVRAFAKTTMSSFGIAEGSALDMAANFGDMATSMGLTTDQAATMSKQLVGLAGDLASFKNIKVDVAQTALTGIFTGETESLKRLGIVMTEQNVQYWAMQNGIKKTFEEMSQAEKTLTRFQYVMAMTTNSQGDFIRTQDGAANQMRIFGEGMKELGVQFGQIVLPAITKVVTALNGFIKYVKSADTGTKTFILVLSGIAATAGPLLFLVGTVIPKVIVGVNLLKVAFANLGTTIKSAGLIGLISAVTGAALAQQSVLDGANTSLSKMTDEEKTSATAIYEKNKQLYASIKAYEELRKSAAQQDAIYKAQTNNDRNTAKIYEQKIAQAKALIVQNRKLLKEIPKEVVKPTKKEADLSVTGESTKKNKKTEAEKAALKEEERIQAERTKAGEDARDAYERILADIAKVNQDASDETASLYLSDRQKEYESLNSSFDEQLALRKQFGQSAEAITDKYRVDKKALDDKWNQIDLENLTNQFAEEENLIQENENKRLENLKYYQEQIAQSYATLRDATSSIFTDIGNSILNAFGPATSVLQQVALAIGRVLVQMGAMAIAEKLFGVQAIKAKKAQASADSIKVGTAAAVAAGPAGLALLAPFIASAMGMVSGAFATVPKFAAGGIVSGPTMGLMGEYPGAKSNPEVIAPLNKLQSMIDTGSGGNMNLSGEFVVRGQDLVLALQRAERQKSRIG
jgi:hypothetical protein